MNKIRSSTSAINLLSTRPKLNLYSTTIVTSKRKFDETDPEESLISNEKYSKINFKRPRMLDMNRIRSIVLGNQSKQIRMFDESNRSSRAFVLPKLTHRDYYTEPKIDDLKELFNEQGQCLLKEFTVGRKHYGSIQFRGLSMNLAGLDLDRIVDIDRRQVTVYPNENDRPKEGEELNCQAIISLIGVYPIDRSEKHHEQEITDPQRLIEINYANYLEKMTDKFQGSFIGYDEHTGTWKFQVEHF